MVIPRGLPPAGEPSVMAQVSEDGTITGFTVHDSSGTAVKKRKYVVDMLHWRFPAISLSRLENAQIAYNDYDAYVVLRD